jgi:DNA-binding MarR family transcriptional regulator
VTRTAAELTAARLARGVDSVRGPLLPTGRKEPGVPLSLERWAGFTVILIAHMLERRYARALQSLGMSVRDFVLLVEIEQRPGLSQSVLAERVGLTRARVSEQLAVLDTAGYVTREMNRLDLRKRRLWLSQPGQIVLEEAKARLTGIDTGWLHSLDPQARPFFTAALRTLSPGKAWPPSGGRGAARPGVDAEPECRDGNGAAAGRERTATSAGRP